MIQVIILKANKKAHLTFKFSSFIAAFDFIESRNLTNRVIDILY